MATHESPLVETKSQDAPWWRPVPLFSINTKNLLTHYSRVNEDELENHIVNFRAKAWNIRPYPCVGMWAFLKSVIQWAQLDDEYEDILQRVKNGETMLDVGCAMGQDLRHLAAGGAPTENMYATDLIPEFWEASYDLFCDRSKMRAKFICSDVFDQNSELARTLFGRVDIFVCGDFFHLFDWEKQIEAATRVVELSRAGSGTMIIGKQIGRRPGKAVVSGWGKKDVLFLHDEETFQDLWSEVEQRTSTEWIVRTRMATLGEGGFWAPKEDFKWMGEEAIGFQFVLTRK
ncbi:MAG: hypothetical protein Q9162_006019 [Coniocarpon cinnabarinum]